MENIELGMRDETQPMGAELNEAEMEDEQLYADIAPRGKFTKAGLKPLVNATNQLLPLFDQSPDYPMLEDEIEVLPTDFVRILSMFKAAADEAVEQGAVAQELAFGFDGIVNDAGLVSIASKLTTLSKDREFKRFLAEETEPEEAIEEEGVEEAPMSIDEQDSLLMGRL